MDRLERIFEIQKNFSKKYHEYQNIDIDNLEQKQAQTKEYILCLIKEATEILDEINWKQHKLNKQKILEDNIIEESIDSWKFLLNIIQLWGFDHNKFYDEFERKSIVVAQKFEQEKLLKFSNKENIAICDIDGILYPWPETFLEFITEREFNPFNEVRFNNLEEFEKYFDLKKQLELKDAYRKSGIKANADVVDGAIEFTYKLKELGYTIILVTARPYQKYQRIYADTLQWLNKHDIKFDAIIWNEDKEKYLIENFPSAKFIIEDDYKNALKLSNAGFKVFLKNTIYNENFNIENTKISRFDKFEEIEL